MFRIKNKVKEKTYPAGTVAYLYSDLGRYDEFYDSLMNTIYPSETYRDKGSGADIVASLNDIIGRMKGEWLWLLGDDHVWAPELLLKLLDRNVDVIVPLCARRKPPFSPTIFKNELGDAEGSHKVLNWGELTQTSGLLKVDGRIGTAGMLIRKKVLDKIGYPWFEIGKECSFLLQEDMYFCKKIQEARFDIYCDLDNTIGHIFRGVVWPVTDKSKWGIQFNFGRGSALNIMTDPDKGVFTK